MAFCSRLWSGLLVLGCSFGSVACSDDAPAPLSYHKDVRPLVEAHCQGCHVAGGIAPFAMMTYQDVVDHKDEVRTAVAGRVMPPWPPAADCNHYQGDRSLSDAQINVLTRWIDEGTLEGNPADYRPPTITQTGLSRVDMSLAIPVPYTPKLSPDEYRCFLIDWPETSETFVTGFRAEPGNPAIVHHVIAFIADPSEVATYEQLDAADPDPGYTCFGGPGGNDFRLGGALGGWAPGMQGGDFPDGTGIRMKPGSKVILQVHYNTLNDSAAPDQTAIQLKIDGSVDKEARGLPMADPSWVRNHTMLIPAGASDVVHSYTIDPSPYMSLITSNVIPSGSAFTVYSATLHMHTRGTHARLQIDRWSGASECLLDIPHWNFHWQGVYPLVTPTQFKPGDTFTIECHWDNSPENQPIINGVPLAPQDLNWGEGTTDEMCLGFMYVTL
jgi:hypothetical protein